MHQMAMQAYKAQQQAQVVQDRLEGVIAGMRSELQDAEKEKLDALQQLLQEKQQAKAEHDRLERAINGMRSKLGEAELMACAPSLEEAHDTLKRLRSELEQSEQLRLKSKFNAKGLAIKAAQEQQRAREKNGRLEELVAALRTEIAEREAFADFDKAAILLKESDEKLRNAEARTAKLEAKEASERLLRQALTAELQQVRAAHNTAGHFTLRGSEIPVSSEDRHDLPVEVAASFTSSAECTGMHDFQRFTSAASFSSASQVLHDLPVQVAASFTSAVAQSFTSAASH